MSDIEITTFAARPEYVDRVHEMGDTWPAFMDHDLVAGALLWQVVPAFPELCVVGTHDGVVIARGRAVPFALQRPGLAGALPDTGWDQVLAWGMADHVRGRRPDTVSALEIAIAPGYLGRGLSRSMLAAMRDAAAAAGFGELLAPVRPTHKHLQPRTPMSDYVATTRADGLPVDPWLRVHVRAGGVIDRVAPASMVMAASLDRWRAMTGLPFDVSGAVEVPQALVPVHCDVDHDHAVYVEPNIWVRHRLT